MLDLQDDVEPETRRDFEEFLASDHTARVYEEGRLVFLILSRTLKTMKPWYGLSLKVRTYVLRFFLKII